MFLCRKEHWKLLGNLKTTVEGLVSTSNPNVWSKYGGLERLCRDMHSILYHGLIHDKVGVCPASPPVLLLQLWWHSRLASRALWLSERPVPLFFPSRALLTQFY